MKIQILLFYDIRLWLVDNIVCNPKENSINITMFPFVLTTNIMLFSKNKFLSRLFDRYIDENKITSFDVALFGMINAITTAYIPNQVLSQTMRKYLVGIFFTHKNDSQRSFWPGAQYQYVTFEIVSKCFENK